MVDMGRLFRAGSAGAPRGLILGRLSLTRKTKGRSEALQDYGTARSGISDSASPDGPGLRLHGGSQHHDDPDRPFVTGKVGKRAKLGRTLVVVQVGGHLGSFGWR